MRDARTCEPLNRYLGVQSKGWTKFTAENDESFEFLCSVADINYWMGSSDPVLLVCSHPTTREAWFVCVTDWFADRERRVSRRVVFDKAADRFDASKAAELLRLTSRSEPVFLRRAPAPPERLVTNLLPILEHGAHVWSARCDLYSHRQVHGRYAEVGGPRASDYLLRRGMLHALRDPRSCPLRHLCDTDDLHFVDTEEWAQSDDLTIRRYWVELLRRTLLHQVKHQLRWQPERAVFYFPAPSR